jgi:hypothetical protein
MDHGTPIATGGSGGDGTSGPFMIDVGLSSTFHIARSWKLTVDRGGRRIEALPALPDATTADARRSEPKQGVPAAKSGAGAKAPTARPGGIGKIIEDALRSAGLMPK